MKPVLKGAAYVLAHTPDMVLHCGTTQTTEKLVNPDSEYLKKLGEHLRPFGKAVEYPPNQAYIGTITPEQLKGFEFPWHDKAVKGADRFGRLGEIMPQDEFVALIKIVDSFDLVLLEKAFAADVAAKIAAHPALKDCAGRIGAGAELAEIERHIAESHAESLFHEGRLVGCVQRAHDIDVNLNAHVMFENLVSKASAVLALNNLALKTGFDMARVDYVIECSEEACGDMNQRGGGNFAKAVAEISGLVNATGSDTRSFCAAPTHALILAASLIKAGTYKNVVVVAGGATAKLGMNGKDHVKKGLPILEDVVAGFAVLISENDLRSPVFNTDIVGRHTVGTGSSPQAVMSSLVSAPLERVGLRISDIDRYSVEMQNPDITKPAGAGDVPEANYKMIAALAVLRKEIERGDIQAFVDGHGMTGWAPTQGHIPSGVPYLGFAMDDLTSGSLNRAMIVGKGSLFLGRMTNLFDGVSIVLERNNGEKDTAPAGAASAVKRVKVALTTLGSEHGVENMVRGAELAARGGAFDVVLIGPKVDSALEQIVVADEKAAHAKMEELLDGRAVAACVTMHYNFPIGVSTVGRVSTPALGRELFLATTTGTSDTDRVGAMVKNAVNGVIAAKAMGIAEPTVGILNLDGARAVERALGELAKKGYGLRLSESLRADGGSIMRGNDLLNPPCDVMVTDSLTGNILMKLFSAWSTGGSYEATGFGYGPGIGDGYGRLVLILSRASGAPVVANALAYAAGLAEGNALAVARDEYGRANGAGLKGVLAALSADRAPAAAAAGAPAAKEPEKEVVTEEIAGIEIFDLDNAVALLKGEGIYAESGMGCTGPVVLVNGKKHHRALEILRQGGFVGE